MDAIARTRYLKGSPRKARLVIDLIRGQNVSRALAILKFTEKRAAGPIRKCLNSAIANATYKAEQKNIAVDPDDLWIRACYVDMGPTKHRRRLRPAPQGRAYREQRHYCHITIEVTSDEKPKAVKEAKADKQKSVSKSENDSTGKAAAKPAKQAADKPKRAKSADSTKTTTKKSAKAGDENAELKEIKAEATAEQTGQEEKA
ncbi:MAG TPA: 50S ribosomal protein L22 [Pyrinomonadaceae bacterium]|jgi:large subunit ribosomal protein L22|nr:50S ribosomal protein L22 [Pyrinomonadaceae bacterium]